MLWSLLFGAVPPRLRRAAAGRWENRQSSSSYPSLCFSFSVPASLRWQVWKRTGRKDAKRGRMSCLLGSLPTPEKKSGRFICFFLACGSFYSKLRCVL